MTKQKAAARPPQRTVHVYMDDGPFMGWEVTAKADFPARLIADLNSGDVARIIGVFDKIVIQHNLPDSDDNIAATMSDVDPYDGLMVIAGEIFDAISKLPNR